MIEAERVLATNRAGWNQVAPVDLVFSIYGLGRTTDLNAAAVKDAHADPARWYSEARARVMPTTFIIKARKS